MYIIIIIIIINSLLRHGGFRGPACLKLSFYKVYICIYHIKTKF